MDNIDNKDDPGDWLQDFDEHDTPKDDNKFYNNDTDSI